MKARDFEFDGVIYAVKRMSERGCNGCAFEKRNEDSIRMTACKICMYRINTIFVEKHP